MGVDGMQDWKREWLLDLECAASEPSPCMHRDCECKDFVQDEDPQECICGHPTHADVVTMDKGEALRLVRMAMDGLATKA